ncbi:MAG: hypothetical protein ACFE8A_09820 [Candidatus Hodarchaeota archaeon]
MKIEKMQYCINCGEVISEHQFDNFNGMCSACIRLNLSRKRSLSDNMSVSKFLLIVSIVILLLVISGIIIGILFVLMS